MQAKAFTTRARLWVDNRFCDFRIQFPPRYDGRARVGDLDLPTDRERASAQLSPEVPSRQKAAAESAIYLLR
jgi:hypothetical protein